jgi:hypothetical protein
VKYLKIVKKEVSLLTDSESVFILKSGAEQHPLALPQPHETSLNQFVFGKIYDGNNRV